MRRRTALLMIVVSLCLGITFAYAQKSRRTPRGRKPIARVVQDTRQRPKDVPPGAVWAEQPRPPWIPTGEEVRGQLRREFLELKYDGIRFPIDNTIPEEERAFHTEIEAAFRSLDFEPPQRSSHFAWLLGNEDIRHRGWGCLITDKTPVRGGHRITVKFVPVIDSLSAGQQITTGDSILETYLYDGRSLRYLGSSPSPDATQSLMLD
jgi:hypothetical protein